MEIKINSTLEGNGFFLNCYAKEENKNEWILILSELISGNLGKKSTKRDIAKAAKGKLSEQSDYISKKYSLDKMDLMESISKINA